MDDPKVAAALKHYEAMRRAQLRYYEKNKEKLNAKRMDNYRANNPTPRPIGRPRKEQSPSPSSEEV